MATTVQEVVPDKLGRPSDKAIAGELQEQRAAVVALRRLLAEGSDRREFSIIREFSVMGAA